MSLIILGFIIRLHFHSLLLDWITGIIMKPMSKQENHFIISGQILLTADIQDGEKFLPSEGQRSQLSVSLSAVLSKINIYIIVDPDTTTENPAPNYLLADDIASIKKWVNDGGVLAVLANDAPNCEFTHLNKLMSEFGMKFNHVTLHPVTGTNFEMGACTNLPDHPLFKGVRKIYIKEVSDINLSGTAKAILTEKGKVLMAENKFGKGYVFAIGDPWIYNEYIDHDRLPESFENRKAAENLTDLLLSYTKKK